MSVILGVEARRSKNRFDAELATTIDDVRASQALRLRVCAQEIGAKVEGAGILVLVRIGEIDTSCRRHFLDRVMKG